MDNVDYTIPEISDLKLLDIDTDAEWEKLSGELGLRRKTKILRLDLLVKIAAALIIVATISIFVNNSLKAKAQSTYTALNTPVEAIVEHSTQISVNRNSSVTCNTAEKGRFSVSLNGEAYFDVEKNPERTFEINTSNVKVIVHGTSFNVCENAETTTVTVTSGVVEVISNKDGKSVKITKDEELTYKPAQGFDVKTVSNYNNIAWKLKEFVFNDTELGDIMEQLSKAYGFQYSFENAECAKNRISGTFANQSVESIIDILNQTLDETDIIQTSNGGYSVKKMTQH
ncbi:MAG: FecR family protein [Bacteroidales bacterium]|nr:FecR family protein [Bacteroidales bacterium]